MSPVLAGLKVDFIRRGTIPALLMSQIPPRSIRAGVPRHVRRGG